MKTFTAPALLKCPRCRKPRPESDFDGAWGELGSCRQCRAVMRIYRQARREQ